MLKEISSDISDQDLVTLSDKELIGTGTRRLCYQYPGKPHLCIKIPKETKNGYLQQRREVKYYRKLLKRGVPTERITHYYGSVNTTLGVGYVYDAICDYDGNLSLQMMDYLKQEPARKDEYLEMLNTIESYLFKHLVIIYDLSPYNILCRKSSNGKLEPFIIDGVGDVVAIPVLNLSKTLVKQKIKRRWMRMIRKLEKRFDWMVDYQFKN